MKRRGRLALGATVVLVAALLALPAGCGTTYERRDPTGERLPTVTGESLSGEEVTFPDDFLGPCPVCRTVAHYRRRRRHNQREALS